MEKKISGERLTEIVEKSFRKISGPCDFEPEFWKFWSNAPCGEQSLFYRFFELIHAYNFSLPTFLFRVGFNSVLC